MRESPLGNTADSFKNVSAPDELILNVTVDVNVVAPATFLFTEIILNKPVVPVSG